MGLFAAQILYNPFLIHTLYPLFPFSASLAHGSEGRFRFSRKETQRWGGGGPARGDSPGPVEGPVSRLSMASFTLPSHTENQGHQPPWPADSFSLFHSKSSEQGADWGGGVQRGRC